MMRKRTVITVKWTGADDAVRKEEKKTAGGYRRTVTHIEVTDANWMPFSNRLHQGEQLQNTNEDRQKALYVSENERKTSGDIELITSDYGTQPRMAVPRSTFSRPREVLQTSKRIWNLTYLYQGMNNAQSILLAIGIT